MPFIVRLLINAAALWAAIRFVPGIAFEGDWPLLFAVALVFGVLNAVIRPVLSSRQRKTNVSNAGASPQ